MADTRPGRVWLSPPQAAERMPGVTVRILEELRAKGRGPTYYKPTARTVLYEQGALDAWGPHQQSPHETRRRPHDET